MVGCQARFGQGVGATALDSGRRFMLWPGRGAGRRALPSRWLVPRNTGGMDMRNLLALSAAALLILAAVGWYLDWYKIKTVPAEQGRQQITIDVNGGKIGEDLSKGKATLRD